MFSGETHTGPTHGIPYIQTKNMESITRVESAPSPAQGVGPQSWPDGEKPMATVSHGGPHENVHVLPQTPQLIALLTQVTIPKSMFPDKKECGKK